MESRRIIKRYKEINLGEVSLPVSFHHASGSYVFDHDGNSFLDFTSGFGVTSSGWLREEINECIKEQLKVSVYAPPWLASEEALNLSEVLLQHTPGNLVKCARASSGAEANEIIFKAVYASSGKKGILSFKRSYHGGSQFTLGLSDADTFHLPQLPQGSEFHLVDPPYCYRCPFGKKEDSCSLECTEPVEKLFSEDKNIGAFFLEPVIGSGGVIIPSKKYLDRIRELCTHYRIFLVFDEVLTAFGRIGEMTAMKLFDVQPDAVSFAKGLGAGYAAIGAAVLNEELSQAVKKFEDVSSTYAWTPLSCAIAKSNIELIVRDKLPENAAMQGKYLIEELRRLFCEFLPAQTGDIRGIGLMIGIELVTDQSTKTPDKKLMQKFIVTALRQGLMVCASWDFQVIILMPPLNIRRSEVEEGIEKIEGVLKSMIRSDRV